MSGRWADSDRKAHLPPNWRSLRQQRFAIDDWTCVDCGHRDSSGASLECDHIGDRDDHRIEQLRTRCGRRANDCHGKRTRAQAAAARAARPTRLRPPRPHPGLR